jgi:hypothetical protein
MWRNLSELPDRQNLYYRNKGISSDTDANKLELNDARYALDLVLGIRDNMMEDVTGKDKDKDKALLLLNFFYEKVQKGL